MDTSRHKEYSLPASSLLASVMGFNALWTQPQNHTY